MYKRRDCPGSDQPGISQEISVVHLEALTDLLNNSGHALYLVIQPEVDA